jgi:hypothetical protein
VLTYRLRERVFQFQEGAAPTYPADASISIALQPPVQFGGVAGVTRNAVTDRPMKAKVNFSTGRFEIKWDDPLFEPVEASLDIADTSFLIKQDVVTVSSRCTSLQDLTDLISTVYYAFPAVLNVYLSDIPFPTHVWGTVGNNRFRWIFEPSGVHALAKVTSKTYQESLITNSWRLIAVVANSRRLMGGLHYFHVACRLLAAGFNRFEFAAEALLNLAKSLQSTFGESRDEVRAELEKLDLFREADIEAKLIPALVLRNEFDVGHVSLALLTGEQLRILHDYTNLAEDAFRDLYARLLEKLEAGKYTLPRDVASVLSSDKEAILRRLGKNIKPFL